MLVWCVVLGYLVRGDRLLSCQLLAAARARARAWAGAQRAGACQLGAAHGLGKAGGWRWRLGGSREVSVAMFVEEARRAAEGREGSGIASLGEKRDWQTYEAFHWRPVLYSIIVHLINSRLSALMLYCTI